MTTKNTQQSKALIHMQQRNEKFYRQAKAKRIQFHQIRFTTNAKGTSPGKPKTRNKKILKENPH